MSLKHPKAPQTRTNDLMTAPLFSLETEKIARHRLPEGELPPDVAYQLIHDELMLDGNARLNVATFVSTWMEPQAEKLMEVGIYRANGYVDHYVKRDLKDHERAALVSLMYNLGPGGFKARGIAEAINSGASSDKVAEMIRNASPSAKKLQPRRAAEANLWLGVAGSNMLAQTDSNGLR